MRAPTIEENSYILFLVTERVDVQDRLRGLLPALNGRYRLQISSNVAPITTIPPPVTSILLLDWQAIEEEKQAALKKLHQALPTLAIIILTDDDPNWNAETLSDMGAHDYLPIQAIDQSLLLRVLRYAQSYRFKDAPLLPIAGTLPNAARDATGPQELEAQLRQQQQEKDKAIERLRANEEQLRLLTDALPALISYVDADGCYQFNNRAYEEWVGHSRAEIRGKHMAEVLGPAAYQAIAEYVTIALTGRAVQYETEIPNKDQGARFVLATYVPDIRADGQVTGFFSLINDITDRKLAEKQILEAQNFAQATIDALSAHICVLNEKGVILSVNRAWRDFAHANPPAPSDHFVGANYLDVCQAAGGPDSEEAASFAAGLQAVMWGDKEQFVWEYACDAPWEKRWFIARVTRFSHKGSPRLVVAHENISERKQAAEALAVSERKYRNLFENAPVGLFRVQHDRPGISEANSEVCNILGIPKETILATPGFINFVYLEEWNRLAEQFQAQGQVTNYEARVKTDNGEKTCLFSMTYYPEDGALQGTIVDITAQKQAEAKFRNLNRGLEKRVRERTIQLEVANKELEAFAYSVSHDLRAPLRAMSGFSGILLKNYGSGLDTKGQHYLNRIEDNARQMGLLIDDLLKFSRLIREPVQRETVDVTAVVKRVLTDLDLASITATLDIVVDELPPCQADPRLLHQVFLNLIENALKYSSRRDVIHIHIGAQKQKDTVVYFVKDNGVGFDMAYADKIFGVFQRLHRPEEYEGTGVGLALVQRIIHRHSGEVWAEAAINEGATLYFTLGNELPKE